jgi:hypothetical protein
MKKCMMLPPFLCLLISMSFAQQQRFAWLAGTWKLKDKPVYEAWKIEKDGRALSGFSYRVKGTDTVAMEQIRLTYDGSTYHYIPDVAGDQGPVDFVITPRGANGFVAENPAHDFPKVIRYELVRKGSLDFIEASIEGNGKVINYVYERVR